MNLFYASSYVLIIEFFVLDFRGVICGICATWVEDLAPCTSKRFLFVLIYRAKMVENPEYEADGIIADAENKFRNRQIFLGAKTWPTKRKKPI